MGRAYEVRKASMAATSAKKSALYMRASKEIYVAAKSGVPDPKENLALRAAIEKFKGQSIPKDVIERAIEKAKGKDGTALISGRYEGMGPGGSFIIIDTLTDNTNRAFAEVRATLTHKGGKIASVAFNFQELGVLDFAGNDVDAVTESLILGDIDVREVKKIDDDMIEVTVAPQDLQRARDVLHDLGVSEFPLNQIAMIPNDTVSLEGEEAQKFKNLIDALDDLEDVQAVYHNVVL